MMPIAAASPPTSDSGTTSSRTSDGATRDEAVEQMLSIAASTQEHLSSVHAVFDFEQTVDIRALPSSVLQSHTEYRLGDGRVRGSMVWTQDGRRVRLETRYDLDLPREQGRGSFEDSLYLDDGRMLIHRVPRTNQHAILRAGDFLPTRTPTDWLLPGGYRATFAELRADPNTSIDARLSDNGIARVRITRTGSDGVTECRLDPEFDFAVVEWTRKLRSGSNSVRISYRRDEAARAVPVRALLESREQGRAEPVWTSSIEARDLQVGPQPESSFLFPYEPGQVFCDNRPVHEGTGRVRALKVNMFYELEEIQIEPPPARQRRTGASVIPAGALSAVAGVIIGGALLYWSRKRSAERGAAQ